MGLLEIWNRTQRLPLIGRRVFSLGYALRAPYFLSIAPTVLEVRPNHAAVRIRRWWGVRNHLGTVHTIAVANGMEMAMGALAEASIPHHLRWIPKGMELEYVALASSAVVTTADTDASDWAGPGAVRIRVTATRADGTVVARGVIHLHVSDKPTQR